MAARAARDFLELDKLPRSFSSHTPQPLLKSSSIIEPGDANTANAYSDSFIDSSRKENGDENKTKQIVFNKEGKVQQKKF